MSNCITATMNTQPFSIIAAALLGACGDLAADFAPVSGAQVVKNPPARLHGAARARIFGGQHA